MPAASGAWRIGARLSARIYGPADLLSQPRTERPARRSREVFIHDYLDPTEQLSPSK
jgi:hypothetical protein